MSNTYAPEQLENIQDLGVTGAAMELMPAIVAEYGRRVSQDTIADELRATGIGFTGSEFMDLVDEVQRQARKASVIVSLGI